MNHLVVASILALASAQCAPPAAREEASSPTMTNTHVQPSIQGSSTSQESATSDRNSASVRAIYDQVINQRRLELLADYVADSYVGPRGERGPAGFSRTIEALVAGVPDIRFEMKEVFATSDRAAVRWVWSGRHTGALFGIPPSNAQVTNSGIAIYSFAEGKIVASAVETDRLGLLQQMGIVSPDIGAPRVAK